MKKVCLVFIMKFFAQVVVISAILAISSALECHVCSGPGNACFGIEDNGVITTCPDNYDACYYNYERYGAVIDVYRSCAMKEKPDCIHMDSGDLVQSTNCWCKTEACNHDDYCSCN